MRGRSSNLPPLAPQSSAESPATAQTTTSARVPRSAPAVPPSRALCQDSLTTMAPFARPLPLLVSQSRKLLAPRTWCAAEFPADLSLQAAAYALHPVNPRALPRAAPASARSPASEGPIRDAIADRVCAAGRRRSQVESGRIV